MEVGYWEGGAAGATRRRVVVVGSRQRLYPFSHSVAFSYYYTGLDAPSPNTYSSSSSSMEHRTGVHSILGMPWHERAAEVNEAHN